jgi:ppGpp synthetase/RelA/SpoT-type nucleotidyltranferase
MAMPLSGNQLKNLTTRLREGKETPDDLHALADVRLYYKEVLDRAHRDVEDLCDRLPHAQPMAPRVKTIKTTLEKLARQPHLKSIAQIRDFAGLRVIVHGSRSDQDDVAHRIAALFPEAERPPKFIDRRGDPRSGYRALHLEVRRDNIPIEIQVRTALQHRWAELFERAADKLGRGLRYGEPTQNVAAGSRGASLVIGLERTSECIDRFELASYKDPAGIAEELVLHEILDTVAGNVEELL